jgi:hypothetical protein
MWNQRLDESLDFDADWELVPQIVETVGTGAAPDHSEELDAFVSLESRIEDLLVLRESILETSGMSQSFALEAQRLWPEFDNKNPIGFYTVAPSATRYAVAIEELSSGIWTLIAAGIAAVIALIVKFMKWLGKGKEEDAVEETRTTMEKLEDAKRLLAECDRLIAEGREQITGKHVYMDDERRQEHNTLDQLVRSYMADETHGKRIKEFLQTKDPFFHDLINHGPYTKEMAGMAVVFKSLQLILRQRLNALEAVSQLDLTEDSLTSNMTNVKTLAALKDPVQVSYQGKEHTLQEIKTSVSMVTREVESQQVSGDLSFDHLFGSMAQALSNSEVTVALKELTTLTPMIDQMRHKLQALEAKAGSFKTDGSPGKHTTMIGTDLRHAIFVLGTDLSALQALTAEVMQYQHRILFLSNNAASFAESVAQKIASSARTEDGAHLDKFREIARKLGERRKELHSLYAR